MWVINFIGDIFTSNVDCRKKRYDGCHLDCSNPLCFRVFSESAHRESRKTWPRASAALAARFTLRALCSRRSRFFASEIKIGGCELSRCCQECVFLLKRTACLNFVRHDASLFFNYQTVCVFTLNDRWTQCIGKHILNRSIFIRIVIDQLNKRLSLAHFV